MALIWHRRDLRAADNRALAVATGNGRGDDPEADGPAVPVFVFDEDVLAHGSPPRVRFMLDALAALRSWYRNHGSDLVVARGDPVDVLPALAAEHDADRVVWGKEYTGVARERDAAVRRALDDAGVARAAVHDRIHHEPGSITTNEGEPYSVYTYFWKKWRDREKASSYSPPDAADLAAVSGDPLPTMADLGFKEPDADLPDAGAEAARDRLSAFRDGPMFRYAEDRDYPAREGTSRLSADLAWGTIGVREVYEATETAMERAEDGPVAGVEAEDPTESVEEFQAQLAWREFYTHVLHFHPEVVTENHKSYEHPIEWREDPEALQAWKDGETGYPIVDAGMRQLRAEAYMHNRIRMIVASFLTKDLLLDWRKGYRWFRDRLVDHDTANNNGGWQWAASTGTDAQPYFRIFNPMTQGERYDPDAEYIAAYVPELRGVDPDVVHSWHELGLTERRRAAPEYPAPIVDHSERREAALAMFRRARGEEDTEE